MRHRARQSGSNFVGLGGRTVVVAGIPAGVVWFALLGCPSVSSGPEQVSKVDSTELERTLDSAPPPLAPMEATPTLPAHMKDHFTQAGVARDAVIEGDLSALRVPATWLAEHKLSDSIVQDWAPHVGDMQNAAQLAVEAADITAAALAVGDMAQACGTCHRALSGPVFGGKSPAGEESSMVADMQRHRWAAERMWEGLVGPSDAAWTAGVAALKDAPLYAAAMASNKTLPKEVFELAAQAHVIGKKGPTAADPELRAELYGEFLATCSGCHQQLGVQPRKG